MSQVALEKLEVVTITRAPPPMRPFTSSSPIEPLPHPVTRHTLSLKVKPSAARVDIPLKYCLFLMLIPNESRVVITYLVRDLSKEPDSSPMNKYGDPFFFS